jgi:predicted DsbA family dithiol-disulfide isomerase
MKNNGTADRVAVTYYTDPLCCWSWALEPQWRRFRFEYQDHVSWRYCMGGLLPGWKQFADPVHAVSRPAQMGPLWMEAAHLSGMPIQNKIWSLNPPASSYPACMAVKCAEEQSFPAGEAYLRLLREAVMIRGKNISSGTILFELAEELAVQQPSVFNVQQFRSAMESEVGLETFRADLNEVQTKNIKRFPALVFRRQGHQPLLLLGYRPYVVWLELMNRLAPDLKRKESASIEEYRAYWSHLLEREEAEMLPSADYWV